MWPSAEVPRAESRPKAGPHGGGSRCCSDFCRIPAHAPTKSREQPSLCDSGRSPAIPVPGSPNEELAAECKSAGYPGTLIPYRCDLSNEEDILSMFSAVRSQYSGVDICINNAGMARPDTLLSGSTRGWKDMFNVNVLALSICTREAYQSMKERNVDDGHIININSMCGHRVPPQSVIHFYSATKYAVTALTEGLRQELLEAQSHIRATCISPGLVETQFAFKLHDKDPEQAAATYEHIKCLKPEDVAEAVLYVLSTPPHVQVGDIQMRPTEQVT
nr:dehydrogenase/reductase SDR family member 11 isoform X2 [Meriones unguiculatus]